MYLNLDRVKQGKHEETMPDGIRKLHCQLDYIGPSNLRCHTELRTGSVSNHQICGQSGGS
jgi:hypothetical protein